jgi:hypothetical protein
MNIDEYFYGSSNFMENKIENEKTKKKEMKIMKEYYLNKKEEKVTEKKTKKKEKKEKKKKSKNKKQPRNKTQKILNKNIKKLDKIFDLKNKTLREMDFQKMANRLNTTKFLYKSRMVIYPVDLYLEIQRNKLFKEESKFAVYSLFLKNRKNDRKVISKSEVRSFNS